MPVLPDEVALIAVHKCNTPRLVTMLSALPALARHRSYSRRPHPMCWLMRLKGSRKLSRATRTLREGDWYSPRQMSEDMSGC